MISSIHNKLSFVLTFLSFLFVLQAHANELSLLELNHPDPAKTIKYTANLIENNKACSFEAGVQTLVKDLSSHQVRALNILESIYFSLDEEVSGLKGDEYHVQVKALTNVIFSYSLKLNNKRQCELIKNVIYEGQKFKLKSVQVEYNYRLGVPTLKVIHIQAELGSEKKEFSIHNYEASGYIPFYEFHVGMAVNVHTNIRRNDRRVFNRTQPAVEPIPAFLFRYGPFFANKDGIGVILVPTEKFALLGTLLLEGEPYKARGLRKREQSVYWGPIAKLGPFIFQYYRDLLGISNGEVYKLEYAPEYMLSSAWNFNPRPFIQYWDQRYVDYYFGTNEDELPTVDRVFIGKETVNYGIMVRNTYDYKQWQFMFTAGIKFHGKEAYRSPTVTQKDEVRVIGGFLYELL